MEGRGGSVEAFCEPSPPGIPTNRDFTPYSWKVMAFFLLTYGARLRTYLFMHTTHDVAKQRSEIPLDGDRRIPEEGLRAGGIAVEDEVVGELPLGTH